MAIVTSARPKRVYSEALPKRPTERPAWVTGGVAEWRRIVSESLEIIKKEHHIPLALTATATVLVLWLAQMTTFGATIVGWVAGVSPSTPLPLAIVRLPGSMFAPAPNLPVWGSLAQVFVVFAVAEIWLGVRRTLTIALVATFITTLSGRLMCMLGPGTGLGLPRADYWALDTGPSVAVVTLVVYLCCVRGAPRILTVVVVSMVIEVIMLPNMAGREHVLAILIGLVAAGSAPLLARMRTMALVPIR